MKKRIVSLALALALLIGMMPMITIEADAYSTSEIVEAALQLLYYNEGSYGSINKDDNGAVSVGKIQWHGNRALNLLKTIVNMDESAAESILGTTLFKEIKTSSNWSTRTVTSAEATALSNLLTTANGKSAQDALATSDVTVYINHGQNLGITDAASLIYFADMENQGGYGMSSRVAKAAAASAGSYGAITLAILHNAALADSVAGDYATRRNRTYNYCLDYVTNDGCVITFRANGGTCATTTMSVEEGNAIGTLPIANFEGMCFEGWYTEPFGGTQVTVATVPSGDMTLYAHYSYIPSQVKLNFDPNGGTLPDAVLTETVDGINIGRPGESLVIFNQSGTKPGTNIYGKEIAVNSQGKITAVREYGDETQLTVPNGGFILSGQQGWDSNAGVSTGGAMFVKQIIAMEEAYVSLNYETGEVKVFDSYAGYLAESKRVQKGTTLGVLPVPTRDDYVFEGWLDANGNLVNYYSSSSGSDLTASWSPEGALFPVATMEFGDHYYELYDSNVTWSKAKELCEANGGHLVVITSAAEQEAVTDFIADGSRGLYRIGATDADAEGAWEWVNGETFSYSNWDQNLPEPSAGEGENYSGIIAIENAPNKQVGEWIDECDVFYGNFYDLSNTGFICEYDQLSGVEISVFYDANGGTGAPENQSVPYGDTAELDGNIPSRFGHSFLGWSTSVDAASVSYKPGQTITLTDNLYLYAVWEKALVLTTPDTYITENAVMVHYGPKWYQIDCTDSGNYLFRNLPGDFNLLSVSLYNADGQRIAYADNPNNLAVFNMEHFLTEGETYYLCLLGNSINFAIHHGAQLTYDANGGEGAPESHWVYSGFIPTLSTIAPSRDGYCNFLGWATSPDAAEPEYQRGASYTANADVTLYAVWAEPTVIPATEFCESVEGRNSTPGAWWYQFTPTVSGNYLLRCDVWQDLTVAIYDESGTHIGTASDWIEYSIDMEAGATYYFKAMPYDSSVRSGFADFYISKGYYVDYDTNGGDAEFGGQYIYYNTDGGVTALMDAYPTRTGYRFLGWSLDPNATTPECHPNEQVAFTEDVTLYAVWEFNGATVYYDPNHDTGSAWTQIVSKYEPTALDSTVPEYSYHAFLGWATSPDAAEPEYQPGDTVTLTEDLHLYAVWEKTTYTVIFDANGGENAPAAQTFTRGEVFVVEDTVPHRLGYTFRGWSTDPEATTATYTRVGASFTVNADVILYAVWKTQSLTVDAVNSAYNGESLFASGPVYFTFTPAEDSYYRLSSSGSHDTKITICDVDGTVLASDDNSGDDGNFWIIHRFEAGKLYNIRTEFVDGIYGIMSLYQRRVYTITYDMNDNSGVTEVQYKEHGTSAAISESVPTSEGCKFLGWATAASATTAEYQPGDTYTANADVILYAVWEQEETVLYGDVNSDGKVNAQDRLYLTRYLAGMTGYTEDMIDLTAADVNCDGKVNTQDRMILTRYLAQWTAYPELPYLS